ncbi:hypothetical protein Cflav_PD2361 [Pedosphaera parvula Ellin514]|uniref:Uncharacterized protein n=1 Tax=Pedosphaera parvula (strain Ellin514) TaxID=320771 RepID=B9XL23_PEDPL|nr:hypothetical protein Cflav_PD2361 [Pedosphaera parvula Ellin514]
MEMESGHTERNQKVLEFAATNQSFAIYAAARE